MPFPEMFPASATLEELQRTLIAFQKIKTANLINITGRNAELDDGTKLNVNLADFEPQTRRNQINKVLVLVKDDDANVAFLTRMTAESMSPLGGAGKKFTVFMKSDETATEGKEAEILIFFKKS
jgi:NADH dehydrogenase/NADH:ubiquinone oxidoreductase subunit G